MRGLMLRHRSPFLADDAAVTAQVERLREAARERVSEQKLVETGQVQQDESSSSS